MGGPREIWATQNGPISRNINADKTYCLPNQFKVRDNSYFMVMFYKPHMNGVVLHTHSNRFEACILHQ